MATRKSGDHPDNRSIFRANVRRSPYGHGGIAVTEHAIVRYVERVLGINADELCAKIIPEANQAAICALGDGEYPIGDTHKVRIIDRCVITCWPMDRSNKTGTAVEVVKVRVGDIRRLAAQRFKKEPNHE